MDFIANDWLQEMERSAWTKRIRQLQRELFEARTQPHLQSQISLPETSVPKFYGGRRVNSHL